MNPHELLRLQLRLEGKEIINGNLLRQVQVVPGEELPLMLIALLVNRQQVTYFAETLTSELLENLAEQIHTIRFPVLGPLLRFLGSQGAAIAVGHYKTYVVPEHYGSTAFDDVRRYSPSDPAVKDFGFDGLAEQIYAMERGGKIVSACVSTREDQFCGEAWVYTDPEYRRQGFARNVVGAWARSLILANKVPFYSHDIKNIASAKLANCLQLQPVFEEVTISYKNV